MFFVLGTGRCGTLSLANTLLEQCRCVCLHEPEPSLIEQGPGFRYGEVGAEDVASLLRMSRLPVLNGKPYGEANQNLALVIPVLTELYPDARYLWVVRDARDVVASAMGRGWYSERGIGGRSVDASTALQRRWIEHRIRGDRCGDVDPDAWARMEAFDKCCWYWAYLNRTLEQDLVANVASSQWRQVRLEDLHTELDTIIEWLGLDRVQAGGPAHHNRATYRRYGADEWTPAQWEVFARWCGPLMDRLYPEWRSGAPGLAHPAAGTPGAGPGVRALNADGEARFGAGDLAGARGLFEQALGLEPRSAETLNNLAVCLWAAGDPGQALLRAAQGLEIAPNDRSLVLNGGRILEACERADQARALYGSYLSDFPDDAEIQARLSALRAAALTDANDPASHHGEDVAALIAEGERHFSAGDLAAAEEALRRALQRQPDHVEALSDLGVVRWHQGDVAEGLDMLRRALEQDSDHRATVINLISVLAELGEIDTLAGLLRAYLERHPEDGELGNLLAGLDGESSDPGAQAETLASLIHAGETRFAEGDLDGALGAFEAARAQAPGNVDVLNNLGVVRWEQGDRGAALEQFAQALESDPDHKPSVINCSRVLEQAGYEDDARALCAGFLQGHPDDSDVQALRDSIDAAGRAEVAGGRGT